MILTDPWLDILSETRYKEEFEDTKGLNANRTTPSTLSMFNSNSAIVLLYHGDNKLIINEMMIRAV
jgi:hypothetical protein